MTGASDELSASERAYQHIRTSILTHACPAGTMLGESALAAELEMSRTPVRVALARLQDEGWIVVYPKRGAVVQGISERMAGELADARYLLEVAAVDRAAPRTRQQLAERLTLSIHAQREAFDTRDLGRFIDLALQFHRGFIEAGGNPVLLELYERLVDRHRYMLYGAGDRLLARCTEIIREHEELIEHLRAGDAAAFGAALRAHIDQTNVAAIDSATT